MAQNGLGLAPSKNFQPALTSDSMQVMRTYRFSRSTEALETLHRAVPKLAGSGTFSVSLQETPDCDLSCVVYLLNQHHA